MTYAEWVEKVKTAIHDAYPGDDGDEGVSMVHVFDAMLGGMLVIPTTQLNVGDTIIFNIRREVPPSSVAASRETLAKLFVDQRVLLFTEPDGIDVAVLHAPRIEETKEDDNDRD